MRFGEFDLDAGGRELRLRGQVLDVQPKVFDLLAYFVRHAGRVIPKEELLDQVWPGVLVTEGSLQRAVSLLRQALRAGDLDHALKSFSGRGYRFSFDQPALDPFLPATIAESRQILLRRDWAKALADFQGRDPAKLGAEELELWAFATECAGKPSDALPLLRLAVERREHAQQSEDAARDAVTLAKIHFERADVAVARGWLARAEAQLAAGPPSEARSYLFWMKARMHAFEGRVDEALTAVESGLKAAELASSTRFRALNLCTAGFMNLSLGHVRKGLEQQDHAAALAMSSSSIDPITGGLIYCNILWACRTYSDWRRANQWQDGFETWCEENFAGVSASCLLHRAEAVAVQGTLTEALVGIDKAIARLPATDPWAVGDAYRVRGDIHAAIGDRAQARTDYDRAYAMGWDAEPGNALLLFESGDVDGALAALDRVLASAGWFGLQRRGWILAHKARICALAGRTEAARTSLDALSECFDEWPSQAVRALAQEAEALLALHLGQTEPSAIQLLNLARQLWTSVSAEHQASRVRLALAHIMLASGDRAGALVEIKCCEAVAERVGARAIRQEAADLLKTLQANASAVMMGTVLS
jgi:tetratricopeptide (TPR) repeat protein